MQGEEAVPEQREEAVPEADANEPAAVSPEPLPIKSGMELSARYFDFDVRGSLSKDIVKRIVRQQAGRIRRCYGRRSEQNADLEGTVWLRFEVSETGESRAWANVPEKTTLADAGVVGCIVDSQRELSFPPPPSGTAMVEYGAEFKLVPWKPKGSDIRQ